MAVRPTLRCLREDLGLAVPSAQVTLDQVDHPLLAKAGEQFAQADTPHERIRSIDDVVLFKVKAGRWRGAVFTDGEDDAEVRDWLVAAGTREDGSHEDLPSAYSSALRSRQALAVREFSIPAASAAA